ncbi:hypothetical protein F2Q68_00017334 [Brassica cretica]|uniref:Uncharacterized protein n=1 Tax=Brassica cretica TaxID=69181 RepID=A0A8S9HWC5_BRACR|nr:hypothetical protein F2Q68_00017334 [Brassica cretica]
MNTSNSQPDIREFMGLGFQTNPLFRQHSPSDMYTVGVVPRRQRRNRKRSDSPDSGYVPAVLKTVRYDLGSDKLPGSRAFLKASVTGGQADSSRRKKIMPPETDIEALNVDLSADLKENEIGVGELNTVCCRRRNQRSLHPSDVKTREREEKSVCTTNSAIK